jgi:hypothetical protein
MVLKRAMKEGSTDGSGHGGTEGLMSIPDFEMVKKLLLPRKK